MKSPLHCGELKAQEWFMVLYTGVLGCTFRSAVADTAVPRQNPPDTHMLRPRLLCWSKSSNSRLCSSLVQRFGIDRELVAYAQQPIPS